MDRVYEVEHAEPVGFPPDHLLLPETEEEGTPLVVEVELAELDVDECAREGAARRRGPKLLLSAGFPRLEVVGGVDAEASAGEHVERPGVEMQFGLEGNVPFLQFAVACLHCDLALEDTAQVESPEGRGRGRGGGHQRESEERARQGRAHP